jgi:Predicted periplasmic lipoprotein (DUF2279)
MLQKYIHKSIFITFLFLFIVFTGYSQKGLKWKTIFEPADSLDKTRIIAISSFSGALYGGVTLGFNQLWYAKYPKSPLHLFDDNGEWLQMDKAGHFMTAYTYSHWAHQAYQWTGLEQRKNIWLNVAIGSVMQGTLEVMDGFSAQWGFSLGDITANTLGVLAFAGQEWAWNEQRVTMKISSQQSKKPLGTVFSTDGKASTTLRNRLDHLGGITFVQRAIKDYDAQTIWASVNVASFMPPETNFPKWLNIAVGYGVQNVYGANSNTWTEKNGATYAPDSNLYPRTRQVFLSLDVDVNRLHIKNKYLRTLAFVLCHGKIAAPTLEFTSGGKVVGHWWYW